MSNLRVVLALPLFLSLTSAQVIDTPFNISSEQRSGKALSVFQVVRFPNIGCTGSTSLNGTCYTSSECSNKGGSSAGSCASGFGVCCTFTLGCGSKIAENCTYFQSASSSQPAGQCIATVCKCSSDICSLRLDMNTFVITGPSTLTLTYGKEIGGTDITVGGVAANWATRCLTDTFSVTGGGGVAPPVICGTNSGYHMYVDASDACNQLVFEMGPTAIGTTLPTSRSWNIKISQISCFDPNLPPSGCTQYFYGSTTGTLNSFNSANGVQLADQRQTICIRRERGYCRTCYSETAASDFKVSGKTTGVSGYIASCCNYGTNGIKTTRGYDCLILPGASSINKAQKHDQICGGYFGTANAAMIRKTICTYQLPFQLQFITDSYTFTLAAKKGFKLAYWETAC